MTKPKWSAEKHAWADGVRIEQCFSDHDNWHPFNGAWTESQNWVYRIKPAVPPEVENAFTTVAAVIYFNNRYPEITFHNLVKNVQLTVDKHYILKNVRMIGKPCPIKMEAELRRLLASF